jgi:hypothetical protein
LAASDWQLTISDRQVFDHQGDYSTLFGPQAVGDTGRPVNTLSRSQSRLFAADAGKTLPFQTNNVDVKIRRVFMNRGVGFKSQHRKREVFEAEQTLEGDAKAAWMS